MVMLAMNDTDRAIVHVVSAIIEANVLNQSRHFRLANNRLHQVPGRKSGYQITVRSNLIRISITIKVLDYIDVLTQVELLQERIVTEVNELIGYRVEHIHVFLH